MELKVAKLFDTLKGPISGTNIKLFQRFSEYWGSIDRSDYESVLKVDSIASALNPVRDDLIQSFSAQDLTVSAKGRLPRASATAASVSRSIVRVRQWECSYSVSLTLARSLLDVVADMPFEMFFFFAPKSS